MPGYSLLLALGLAVSSPWWVARMLTTKRYREGLSERLGCVPRRLRAYAAGHRIVWLHAVSVGEVLAASRLVAELEAALRAQKDDRFRIVVSTTTRTGQALARERFGAERVFYYPLDFAFAVRPYLEGLRPEALVLMESELWPRMMHECGERGIPVAVANARVSDRSFARARRFRALWSRLLRQATLFLAQAGQDAARLVELGVPRSSVRMAGNLKYDVRAPKQSRMAERIHEAAKGRPIVVAGSTVARDGRPDEDQWLLEAWKGSLRHATPALLVIAPRHPERFDQVAELMRGIRFVRASRWTNENEAPPEIDAVLLDTIGDLASVYGVASMAFVGGSLVPAGGHNPLEPAQFGVPVVMGPSYENFRGVVALLQEHGGIRIVESPGEMQSTLIELLNDRELATAIGRNGRGVFEEQQGATGRTVEAILGLIASGEERR